MQHWCPHKCNYFKLLSGSFHLVSLLSNFSSVFLQRCFLNYLEFFPSSLINKSAYFHFKLEYLVINLTRSKKCILDSSTENHLDEPHRGNVLGDIKLYVNLQSYFLICQSCVCVVDVFHNVYEARQSSAVRVLCCQSDCCDYGDRCPVSFTYTEMRGD